MDLFAIHLHPQEERQALKQILPVAVIVQRDMIPLDPKRLSPIDLHGERDICNSVNIFLSVQTITK